MTRHRASFEIDSESDAAAARRLLERVYDTVREESRTVRTGGEDGEELLDEFRALRDAARRPAPGTLTIEYERRDGEFGD